MKLQEGSYLEYGYILCVELGISVTLLLTIHVCPLQCGVLQESVFSSSLTEKVRFRVLTSPLEDIMDTGEQLRVVVEGVTLGELRSTEILIAGKFMLQSELSDYYL